MTDHGPDCACTRCVGFTTGNTLGFQEGNELALRHGAFSLLRLEPRVEELTSLVRDLVPGYRPHDDVAVLLLAISLARIEAAHGAVLTAGPDELVSLDVRLRQWINSAATQANKLGMNPTARGRLGLDVAQTRRALTLTDLHAAAADEKAGEAQS